MENTLDPSTHVELNGLIEDAVSYFCDEHGISGQLAWLAVETFAQAKQVQYRLKLWVLSIDRDSRSYA